MALARGVMPPKIVKRAIPVVKRGLADQTRRITRGRPAKAVKTFFKLNFSSCLPLFAVEDPAIMQSHLTFQSFVYILSLQKRRWKPIFFTIR